MVWVLYHDKGHYLKSELEIGFFHFFLLKELGIIAVEEAVLTLKQSEQPTKAVFRNGNKVVILRKETSTPNQYINMFAFTRVGKELLKLIEVVPNQQYLEKLASVLKSGGSEVFIADFLKEEGGQTHYTNEKPYEGV